MVLGKKPERNRTLARHGDKSNMYVRVTFYCGCLVVLNCFVMCGWVYVGCFDSWLGVLVICVLAFTVFCTVCTVFLYCFIYVHLFLFVLSVLLQELLSPGENSIAVRNNTPWLKRMDSVSYVYISWTIHGMWMMYITFETGPKFSNTTARALA